MHRSVGRYGVSGRRVSIVVHGVPPVFSSTGLHDLSPEIEQVGFSVHLRCGRVSPVPQQHVELRGVPGHEELRIVVDRIGLDLEARRRERHAPAPGFIFRAHDHRPRRLDRRQRSAGPVREAEQELVDAVDREVGREPGDIPAGTLRVDPMDRGLVGLTARPERERRRGLEERPRLQIGRSRVERLHEDSVTVREPRHQLVVFGPSPDESLEVAVGRLASSTPDEPGRPSMHAPDVSNQIAKRPVGAGRHRRARIGGRGDRGQAFAVTS